MVSDGEGTKRLVAYLAGLALFDGLLAHALGVELTALGNGGLDHANVLADLADAGQVLFEVERYGIDSGWKAISTGRQKETILTHHQPGVPEADPRTSPAFSTWQSQHW